MPYNRKLVKMAQEPVAYILYKKRHFLELDNNEVQREEKENKKDFKTQLLKIANAGFIKNNKFQEIV